MPDRWRRTPQEEFREQVRVMRRLHSTAMSDDDAMKRQHARGQWFDEVQITLEQLAEQPTVWRGVQDQPATVWQFLLNILSASGSPAVVWLVIGILLFAWVTGMVKLPFAG